jgi:UDP-N-acetylmuramate: L-alanyl-gamma-D-glutamyl-meso-diaminopimelate ligase
MPGSSRVLIAAPANFGLSARLGGRYFVIEADEYDTAFDKRAKFVHYRPAH